MPNLTVSNAIDLFMQSITKANMRASMDLGNSAILNVGNVASTVAAGDDPRFTDARTPLAHAATHAAAGSDPVTLAQSQITNLTTDLAAKANLSGADFTGPITITTPLAATSGGTGNAGYVAGEILYALNGTTLSRLTLGAAGSVLHVQGSAPAWTLTPSLTTISTSSTASFTGSVGIGGLAQTNTKLSIAGNATGNSGMYGIYISQAIQSDVTGDYYSFWAAPSTAASAFNLSIYTAFLASGMDIGAGSSVTSQYGFRVSTQFTGATNNYAFFSGMPAASGRWNIYMSGDAANYMAGQLRIGNSASAGSYALQVTGTAYVQDSMTVGDGSASSTRVLTINGGSNTNTGSYINFSRAGTAASRIGVDGPITGSSTADLGLWANTGNSISFYVNGSTTRLAQMTTSGLSLAGAYSVTTNAFQRTTKSNFNLAINVKDHGAVGDGVANDTTPISDAFTAAIAAGGTVYFPAGTYLTDAISLTSVTKLGIVGEGMGVTKIKARTPSRVLVVATSSNFYVSGITFDGSCTARTAGQQAVTLDASNSIFTDNAITNSGEYAFFAGSGATTITNLTVCNNHIYSTFADGINFQNVKESSITGNNIDGADDDCIAVGYNATDRARAIIVANNYCRSRSDLATTWGRGIAIIGAIDVVVANNYITEIKQTGLYIAREAASGPCNRVLVTGNLVTDVAINSGYGAVMYGTDNCTFENNTIQSPYQGNLLDIADWSHLTIKGNILSQHRDAFARAIHVEEGTGWSNATWYNLVIANNTIRLTGASTNSSIYLDPDATYTMERGLIDNNNAQQVVAGNYITIDSARCSTLWKVVNNTDMTSGRTINVSTGGIFTVTNNN